MVLKTPRPKRLGPVTILAQVFLCQRAHMKYWMAPRRLRHLDHLRCLMDLVGPKKRVRRKPCAQLVGPPVPCALVVDTSQTAPNQVVSVMLRLSSCTLPPGDGRFWLVGVCLIRWVLCNRPRGLVGFILVASNVGWHLSCDCRTQHHLRFARMS